ncbi:hypothetical protein STANM309S_02003 [Streptomyces tanashiensis]
MPNSRTLRPTAAEVRSPATRTAASSTAYESHLPTFAARPAAVSSEPETVCARSAEVVTVVPGTFFWMAVLTASMRVESVAFT